MDFTIVDGVVLAVIAISAILAYSRGLVREALSIVAWIVAAVVAFVLAPAVEPLMREVPVLRDIIGASCELGVLAGFAVVFAAALIVFSIFTPLVAGAVSRSALGPVDQGLGFLFGVARGVLLVLIAFLVYEQVVGGGAGGVLAVDRSQSRALFGNLESDLARTLPADAPMWVAEQYETLTRACNG
jgi:membrane protein required for colicin V production